LPDGIFSNQKSRFGLILEGLEMEKVETFYGNFEYITAIWYILWPFAKLVVIWSIFPRFGILYREKCGNPGPNFKSQTSRDTFVRMFKAGLPDFS
jgi:hypothetical protein